VSIQSAEKQTDQRLTESFLELTMTQVVCTSCGTIGQTKRLTPGSFWVELALFLFLIIPGVIYGIWHLAGRKLVCAVCGSANLVPIDTPIGKSIAAAPQNPAAIRATSAETSGNGPEPD